jgi:hypothetical protein
MNSFDLISSAVLYITKASGDCVLEDAVAMQETTLETSEDETTLQTSEDKNYTRNE